MSAGGTSQANGEALRLEVVSGKASGFAIVVGERLVIGRHSEGPGRLADDPELSRHHAQISRDDDGTYLIEDLASTNGTIVNGSRISTPTELAVGDSIEVGATTIRVAEAPAKPEPAPAVDVRAATVTVDVPAAMREPPPPIEAAAPPAETAAPPVEAAPPTEEALPATAPAEVEDDEAPVEAAALPIEPLPAAVEEPAGEPAATEEPAAPRLALQLVFDPQSAEVEIRLDDASEPIRLALTEGRWQVKPDQSD